MQYIFKSLVYLYVFQDVEGVAVVVEEEGGEQEVEGGAEGGVVVKSMKSILHQCHQLLIIVNYLIWLATRVDRARR